MKKVSPIHLIKYTTPVKQTKTVKDVICLHMLKGNDQTLYSDGRHPNGEHVLDLKLQTGDRAIVLSVEMSYYTNDTQCAIEMELDLRFATPQSPAPPPPLRGGGGGGGAHPDTTGRIRFILCPAHPGTVPKSERKLYEPNLLNLGTNLLPFAGLEHAILNEHSWQVQDQQSQELPSYEIFARTDPLIVFIDEHRQHFQAWIKPSDVLLAKDQMHYLVQKDALKRIRQFFKDAVFPLFHYTRGDFALTWKTLGPVVVPEEHDYDDVVGARNDGFSMVVVCLKVTYVVIKQDLAQFYLERLELK